MEHHCNLEITLQWSILAALRSHCNGSTIAALRSHCNGAPLQPCSSPHCPCPCSRAMSCQLQALWPWPPSSALCRGSQAPSSGKGAHCKLHFACSWEQGDTEQGPTADLAVTLSVGRLQEKRLIQRDRLARKKNQGDWHKGWGEKKPF